MVVTAGTVFIRFVPITYVFPKNLSAFLAPKNHFCSARNRVVCYIRMTFGAVKPLPAAGGSDLNLGVQYVLTHFLYRVKEDEL